MFSREGLSNIYNFDFSNRAVGALNQAETEAIRLNHHYIGTEHILLGLTPNASRLFRALGLDPEIIREEVGKLVVVSGLLGVTSLQGIDSLTPRGRKIIELAVEDARHLDDEVVTTEHLLVGVIREDVGFGASVLERMGVNSLRLEHARPSGRLVALSDISRYFLRSNQGNQPLN